MITTWAGSDKTHDIKIVETKEAMHKYRVLALRQMRFCVMPARLVREFIL